MTKSSKLNLLLSQRFTICVMTLLGYIVFPCLEFRSILFGEKTFKHWDLISYEFTMRRYFWKLIEKGVFTFLYSDNSLGLSLFGNPHYKILYPTNLFFFLFDSPLSAFHFDHFLHIGILGLGWFLGLLSLEASPLVAAFISSVLCNTGIVWCSHMRVEIASFAWTGWLLWSALTTLKMKSYRRALLTGLFVALIFLGGNPELLPIMALMLGLILIDRKELISVRQLYLPVLSLAVFFLIAAPILVTAYWTVPLTVRAYDFDTVSAFQYSQTAEAVLQFFSGIHWNYWLPKQTNIPVAATAAMSSIHVVDPSWYWDISIGLFPAICLWIGFYSSRKRVSTALTLLIVAFMFNLSLGIQLPWNIWVWTHIPGLTHWRYPGKVIRYIVLLVLPMIIIGLNEILKRIPKKKTIPAIWILFLSTLSLLLLLRPESYLQDRDKMSDPGPFALIRQERLESPKNPPRVLRCALIRESPSDRILKWFDIREFGIPMAKSGESSETPVVRALDCSWINSTLIAPLFGISHIAAPRWANYETEKNQYEFWKNTERTLNHPEIDLFRVKQSSPALATFVTQVLVQPLSEMKNLSFYKMKGLDAAESIAQLRAGWVLLDPRVKLDTQGKTAPLSQEEISQIKDLATHQMKQCSVPRIQVPIQANEVFDFMKLDWKAPCAGLLVVPWSMIPGWKASIDGIPTSIYRINDTLIGLIVPQEGKNIELYFEPIGLAPLLLVSILVFFSLISLGLIALGKTFAHNLNKINLNILKA